MCLLYRRHVIFHLPTKYASVRFKHTHTTLESCVALTVPVLMTWEWPLNVCLPFTPSFLVCLSSGTSHFKLVWVIQNLFWSITDKCFWLIYWFLDYVRILFDRIVSVGWNVTMLARVMISKGYKKVIMACSRVYPTIGLVGFRRPTSLIRKTPVQRASRRAGLEPGISPCMNPKCQPLGVGIHSFTVSSSFVCQACLVGRE